MYDHVAVVAPGLALDRRRALAAAARSRGEVTTVDAEIRETRDLLADLGEPVPSLEEPRRRVASAESALASKREHVATLRGRMRESDSAEVDAAFRDAIRDLSEAELEYEAAREALAERRKRARRARDVRERRLQLEDRLGNLERTARGELVESVRPAVDDAVPAVPGSDAASFADAGAVTGALALLRVGRVRTPVVLACRRFPDARRAEAWLAVPAIRV